MGNIKIIPTFLRIKVDEKSHKIVQPKLNGNRIDLTLKSFFNFNGVAKTAKTQIYKDILAGAQVGNILLPYIGLRPAPVWHYGAASCDLENMHTTDRILICENAREVSEEEIAAETLFAETNAAKKLLTIHMDAQDYDKVAPGDTGLKVLIRNFYDDKNVLFDCFVDKIPVPGQDEGNYVFSDGSRTDRNAKAGEEAAYDWGNLSVKGTMVKAAIGSGRSKEWNAAAERQGCMNALKNNLCGWTKEDDVTVFFDSVYNAYSLLGWYSKNEYVGMIEELAANFKSLTFYHIDAHTGAVGNELADSMANILFRETRYSGLNEKDGLSVITGTEFEF